MYIHINVQVEPPVNSEWPISMDKNTAGNKYMSK